MSSRSSSRGARSTRGAGTLHFKTPRGQQTGAAASGSTNGIRGWTVIKVDEDVYRVQTRDGHDSEEVSLATRNTCTCTATTNVLDGRANASNVGGEGYRSRRGGDAMGTHNHAAWQGPPETAGVGTHNDAGQGPPETETAGVRNGHNACVHVLAAAKAVKFNTVLKRLDWRRSLARLREARAAAAAAAAAAVGDSDDDDEEDGHDDNGDGVNRTGGVGGSGRSHKGMFDRDEPTPLEVKMRRWEQRRKEGYRFQAPKDTHATESTSEDEEDDNDDDDGWGFAAGPRDRTPPYTGNTPPPAETFPGHGGAAGSAFGTGGGGGGRPSGARGSREGNGASGGRTGTGSGAGGGRADSAEATAQACASAENVADGGELYDAFVSKWKRFIKGDVAVPSLERVPLPTDTDLDRMMPRALPPHRKRTRLRQLLLLFHPDKATSKLSERLPPAVRESVWTRLKEVSQKLTELGRVVA
jgi:hypothetical protein